MPPHKKTASSWPPPAPEYSSAMRLRRPATGVCQHRAYQHGFNRSREKPRVRAFARSKCARCFILLKMRTKKCRRSEFDKPLCKTPGPFEVFGLKSSAISLSCAAKIILVSVAFHGNIIEPKIEAFILYMRIRGWYYITLNKINKSTKWEKISKGAYAIGIKLFMLAI